jgi:general secretion pathway protein K
MVWGDASPIMPRLNPKGESSPGPWYRSRTGSVILLVLMTLLLTSFALTKYLEKMSVDLLADARDARADRLRVHAYSALETTLAVLQEFRATNGALHSPTEGWGNPLDFAGYTPPEGLTVEATIEDESGKISLPHADFPTLRNLFQLLGQKQADAERLADALLVWIQKGYEPADSLTARATDYERAVIPHDPPGRSLHSFSELASIQFVRDTLYDEAGHPNDLWRAFADSVSLFDFSQPNINTAKMTTLAALGNYDEATVKMISDYLGGLGSYSRQGPAYFKSAQDMTGLVGQAASTALGAQVRCLRVTVTVSEGSASYRVGAVVTSSGGAQLPPSDPPTTSDTSTGSAAANDTTSAQNTSTSAGSSAVASTSTDSSTSTSSQTGPALNYPFTLLEIRENDEIVDTAVSTQPSPQ